MTRWAAVLVLVAGVLSGCSTRVSGIGSTDSSSAFSAFSRPQRPIDPVPASLWTPPDTTRATVPDAHTDRRVATSKYLAVYLIHVEPDVLCVVVQDLPGQSTGGQGCDNGPHAIASGLMLGWRNHDSAPATDHTAVLVPDGYTATITKGTFELAGQGVLVVQGNGIEVTLRGNEGRTIHLSSPPRPQG